MHASASQPLRINPSLPVARDEALRLALSHVTGPDRPRHIAAWRQTVEAAGAEVWTAQQGERLVAAAIVEIQPGRSATILPPHAASGEPPETATRLLAGVLNDLRQKDVRLAQVLLPHASQQVDQDILESCGFCAATELLYLVRVIQPDAPPAPPDERLEFLRYTDAIRERFAQVVAQTYAGTLDIPAWHGALSIDDVLQTYQAAGGFDPKLWLLVRHGGADVGCLILADHPGENACELVYLGLIPQARGLGFGRALVQHAEDVTRQHGRARLTAAVDAANWTAVAIYQAREFFEWDRRRVFLRVLD
ncbi:MAG: GNAT family N-acetyltransferase [Pirellulales bacterium]